MQVSITVSPALLTVKADDKSMPYGGTLPSLAGTLAGVVNSDGITASYGATATPTSAAGKYPIVATLNDPGSRLSNYSVTNTPGTLTIDKAASPITWPAPAAITYGTALSAVQLNASSTTPGTLLYTPALGTVLSAGVQTLSVTLTPTDGTNYSSATQTVHLTVNTASLTVQAEDKSMTYGGALPALTGTLTRCGQRRQYHGGLCDHGAHGLPGGQLSDYRHAERSRLQAVQLQRNQHAGHADHQQGPAGDCVGGAVADPVRHHAGAES